MATAGSTLAPDSRLTEVLTGLRMLIAQLRLYPKTSPQVSKVGQTALPAIVGFLDANRTLTLASTPEGLLINGGRFPADDPVGVALESSVLALLREATVKSVTLRTGLTGDELVAFLHAFANKFWDLRDGKKINGRLREERVENASVDEVEYVELNKDDLLLKDAAPKLEAAGFDVADLLKTIDDRLEAAIQHGKGPEARLGILRKMLDHDPTLLAQVIREGVATASPGDTPGLLTVDQALDTVRKIWKSMAAAGPEAREAMKVAAESLLGAFEGNARATALLAEAINREAPELLPAWMKGAAALAPGDPPPVARARTIFSLTPEAKAEALFREGKGLVRELIAAERTDLAERVLDETSEQLEENSARRKSRAAEAMGGWTELLGSEPLAKSWEKLLKRLNVVLDRETEAPVYSKLVQLAGIILESLPKKVGGGGELLDTVKRHASANDPAFPDRAGLARPVFSKFDQSAPVPAGASERVAAALHAASIQFLITQMKDMENASERLELAETVSRMGSDGASLLAEELKKTKIPSEVIRLLEVLPWVAESEVAEETCLALLAHPVLMVRKRAAMTLAERKYPRSEELLLDAFGGKDPATRTALAEPLAKLGGEAALTRLRATLDAREQPDEVRSACAAALAKAVDPKALPLLMALATPQKGGLTRIFRSVSPALRAASVKALGAFLSISEVKVFLERMGADPDDLVKAAAKEALRPAPKAPAPEAAPAAPAAAPASPDSEASPSQEIKGFSGLISEITLDQICQVIAGSRMTGRLLVNFEGPTAKIYFEKGLMVAADFEGKKDQEAFNAFFPLKDGAFVFKPGERTLEPRVKAPIDQVLMGAFTATRQAG